MLLRCTLLRHVSAVIWHHTPSFGITTELKQMTPDTLPLGALEIVKLEENDGCRLRRPIIQHSAGG